MPINDFPGTRNWGYDGVLPFAPDRAYGTPDELKALVDAAHDHGLMIFLDVVYNHFGPDGNYLAGYAPQFFRHDVTTPWGPAIDFRRGEVRRFFTENALYWLMEYRFDGLRFDAVHAITEPDWLDEMAAEVRATVEQDRQVHLVLEHDGNVAEHLRRDFDAQWNDDGASRPARDADRRKRGLLRRLCGARRPSGWRAASREGFIYQGEPSSASQRRGARHAERRPAADRFRAVPAEPRSDRQPRLRRPPDRSVAAARRSKPRSRCNCSVRRSRCSSWARRTRSTAPFQFFTDHHGELADAVREGRRREFASFAAFSDPARRATDSRSERGRDVSSARGRRRMRSAATLAAPLSPAARLAARTSSCRASRAPARLGAEADRAGCGAGALAARRWRQAGACRQSRRRTLRARAPGRRVGLRNRRMREKRRRTANSPVARTHRVPGAVPWMKRSASSRAKPESRTTGSMPPARRAGSRSTRCAASWRRSGFPATSEADVAQSRARLREATSAARTFVTATVGKPIVTDRSVDRPGRAGGVVVRERRDEGDHGPAVRGAAVVPPIARARLSSPALRRSRDHARGRAAALRDVGDIAPGERLWGLAVQLYSLRRADDDGIGDTGALARLGRERRARGRGRDRAQSDAQPVCRRSRDTSAPIRRRAGCFSIRCSPIRRCVSGAAPRRRRARSAKSGTTAR